MGKYLRVDDQATLIDVYCDGFIFRVQKGTTSYNLVVNNAKTAGFLRDYTSQYWNGGTAYAYTLNADPNKTVEILSNTPSKVSIRTKGNFYNATAAGYITNSTSVTVYYDIYPDRISKRIIWERSDSITLASTTTESQCALASLTEDTTTSFDGYYESSGSEVDGSDAAYNDANYLLFMSDEINAQMIVLDNNLGDSSSAVFDQWLAAGDSPSFIVGRDGDTLSGAGEIDVTVIFIFDSAEREAQVGDSSSSANFLYTEADRITMGIQYKGSDTKEFYVRPDGLLDETEKHLAVDGSSASTSLGPDAFTSSDPDMFDPGDTVYFMPGNYTGGSIDPPSSGVSGNLIRYVFTDGAVVTGGTYGVKVTKSYVQLDNYEIYDCGTYGMHVFPGDAADVEYVYINNIKSYGHMNPDTGGTG